MDIENYLSVTPTGLPLRDGRLLVSTPFFNDAFFNHSVVLLTDHSEKGSAGLVLNRITSVNLKHIRIDAQVYLGGPVPSRQLFAIHNFANCKQASKLLPWIYVGYDNILLSLIEHNAIEHLRYRFFAGYSGWSAGQLESELEQKMWVIGNATPELVFDTPTEQIWETAVRNLGNDYLHWLQVPMELSSN